ncbi:MAG: hypothetical protein KAJ75_04640, partial [Alphaproteobacteria bacterium]|nr:hypothetical protein [Alphaproteobacteria bacterium]
TLSKRIRTGGFSIALKIEFSAPKLLFGNNFEELEDTDFEPLLIKLHAKLKEMNVDIPLSLLRTAEITGIHYGKNIILTNATSSLIINMIRKFDISKRLDVGNTDFRNEGQAIRFHTNNYELTFYDKMKDLEQTKISDKRALEKDSSIQLDLFTKEEAIRNEVLRMELRLGNKRKLKEVMRKVGLNQKLTQFDCLFSKEIARRFLLHFWSKFIEPSLNIVILCEDSLDVLFHKIKSAGIKDAKALQIMGTLAFTKEFGIRPLKSMLSKNGNAWNRLKKEIALIENKDNYLYDAFKSIKQDLIDMKSIRDFKDMKI